MFLSVFDIFKIGVGPSSSHTMGPMTAANQFLSTLFGDSTREPGAGDPTRISVSLHGSLAFTGKGHATDRAVILGLLGFTPATLDPDAADQSIATLQDKRLIARTDGEVLAFDPHNDLRFDYDKDLPGHPNGLVFQARDASDRLVFEETYYSIGGGFVVTEAELSAPAAQNASGQVPYGFRTAKEMLEMGAAHGKSIVQMKRDNEAAAAPNADLDKKLDRIWEVMNACVERGLRMDGVLPGGLNVRRRAKQIRDRLEAGHARNDAPPHLINDWISLYAMAVNEENAAGGRVVTAPTNGAAGVTPAVLKYFLHHVPNTRGRSQQELIRDYLLTAAAIGGIVKANASISGAEVGCQGEVGAAAAMAAGGLCAILGGSNEQIENAAEIALEHHLGMTCDPVNGLVQVPCIERNGLGAVKAVTAASLALHGDGQHFMPLDNCIEAMRQTGRDMNRKYKETSLGGLAVNLPEC